MNDLKKSYFSCIALLLLLHLTCNVFAASDVEAKTAIADAEDRLVRCYQAAVNADASGANTTDLLVALNEAGRLLSRSKWAFEQGDFDLAVQSANQSVVTLEDFEEHADAVREMALHQNFVDFMFNVVGSIIGTIFVVVAGFAAWFLLKRRGFFSGAT